ncbi:ATP-binding cassette domain-containing protein [Helicobacter baculiformis]|uniref:ATP-binding cassette domain-containing protein n=1 Tax=Helicobacter baculiformis TaxID=427351 RepID=A0ABV7ZES4_9HELI|nr:ATP-binding cassette domain-containing protein [Helicobacter baculiformis]
MKTALKITNLHHQYEIFSLFGGRGNFSVLKDICLSVQEGNALGLMGLSGSGKSTLANIVMGFIRATSGSIEFFGQPVVMSSLRQRRAFYQKVQMVFQDPIGCINPTLSVFEVLAEPLTCLLKLKGVELEKRVKQACDMFYIPQKYLHKRAILLSGGELGRVCLARACAIYPKFLILDESLSSFDLVLQHQIIALLKELKGQISFLFITHDLRLAKTFCDEIILLDKGRIVEKILPNQSFRSQLGRALTQAVL